MISLITKITNEIYTKHVTPLCTHPETGEQCESDYTDAEEIVKTVLKGLGISNYEKMNEFEFSSRPLIKYICEKHHPHISVIVTPTCAELLKGEKVVTVTEYVQD